MKILNIIKPPPDAQGRSIISIEVEVTDDEPSALTAMIGKNVCMLPLEFLPPPYSPDPQRRWPWVRNLSAEKKGLLVAIEGIDGAGKSTLAKALKERLEAYGLKVLLTREPTNESPHGQIIRAHAAAGNRLPPDEELEAFIKDREWHVSNVINPGLLTHDVVITDRYYMSTAVYQPGRGGGPTAEEIIARCEKFAPRPLWVLVECNPFEAHRRILSRGKPDAFEASDSGTSAIAELSRKQDRFDYLLKGGQHGPCIKVGEYKLDTTGADVLAQTLSLKLHRLRETDNGR